MSGGLPVEHGLRRHFSRIADVLFGAVDVVTDYKKVVLGLIFLKYISDSFENQHARLVAQKVQGADPENPAEYYARGIFWVPPEALWPHLVTHARQPTIGLLVDDAIAAIERDNAALQGVFSRGCIRLALERSPPGKLIDLVSNIKARYEEARPMDEVGQVYEYFLSQFARAEGWRAGEFYTPRCVVRLLVELVQPLRGLVYDPCCGSAGMLIHSVEFARSHAKGSGSASKSKASISIFGQDSDRSTLQLAKMNLAIHGMDAQVVLGDTFRAEYDPYLEADFVLASPPLDNHDWGGDRLKKDLRWKYGVPPVRKASFAWLQHIIHHLAPTGVAGIVLPNESMSSRQSSERKIRKELVEADLVDCIVALPGQLFYSTPRPVCLWLLARDRRHGELRDRRGEVLFIDAKSLGQVAHRSHLQLAEEEIHLVADTYHAWRREQGAKKYEDILGFCKSASLEQVRNHGHLLTPELYVGSGPNKNDVVPVDA